MSDADLEEIRDAAGRNNLTVSAWVRRTVRDAAGRERRGGAPLYTKRAPTIRCSSRVRYATSQSRRG